MWLVADLTPADIDDPQPDTVIAGRIEADHLGEPFKVGALLIMRVLVLLCHKSRRLGGAFGRAQQGHRGALRTSATIRRRRSVAIELGM